MKTVLLIDGGYLRACWQRTARRYDNLFIEKFAKDCMQEDEYLLRIFYYDSPQYNGKHRQPISGNIKKFEANSIWLDDLAKLERFAVRRGSLGFRGWRPRNIPISGKALSDEDFGPVFEQKGVDMRLGLDIATFSNYKTADRILLVSGDTDMVPAVKYARKAGLEVGLIQLAKPTIPVHPTLQAHSDFVRAVPWPEIAK